MTEPASPSPTTPLPYSPPSLPSKLTQQHIPSPLFSTTLSSSAPAVGSFVAVHSTGTSVSTAALPAVNEADDVMCVGQNASDCGDGVASREVGCVDVLSASFHITVFACAASLNSANSNLVLLSFVAVVGSGEE
ncbi:hypothetical protein BLNAU_10966 [Blattamonas nauphoetae]|uniref:Uncharacterized protein n=1 Tax=Blattamonas nauphoetae TaxID=2049346 RepID=A0ABQ9XR74_9EUKA|nr:hypothetical protein BLNAU_10966 [Blattamonas nauphoetae]